MFDDDKDTTIWFDNLVCTESFLQGTLKFRASATNSWRDRSLTIELPFICKIDYVRSLVTLTSLFSPIGEISFPLSYSLLKTEMIHIGKLLEFMFNHGTLCTKRELVFGRDLKENSYFVEYIEYIDLGKEPSWRYQSDYLTPRGYGLHLDSTCDRSDILDKVIFFIKTGVGQEYVEKKPHEFDYLCYGEGIGKIPHYYLQMLLPIARRDSLWCGINPFNF